MTPAKQENLAIYWNAWGIIRRADKLYLTGEKPSGTPSVSSVTSCSKFFIPKEGLHLLPSSKSKIINHQSWVSISEHLKMTKSSLLGRSGT